MTGLPFILTAVFFAALLVIAAWGMKKTQNINDFFLGGTAFGPWLLAISYGTAYFSAVVFIGFAGNYGWSCGFKSLWVGVFNAIGGGLLAWLVLGKRTRAMTRRLNAMTMPEFFAARYNTNGMKIITAMIIFIFLLPYSASVFAGLSYLFQRVIGWDFWMVLTITTAVTGVYIVLGGYKAAARIDFLLGMIMFFGTLLMAWFVLNYFGGPREAISQAIQRYHERTLATSGSALEVVKPIPNIIFWSVVFMTSFAPWGLPQMVHKYYAIKDESQITRGAIITLVFAFMIGCAAYMTGAMSHLLPDEVLSQSLVPEKGTIDPNKLVPLVLVTALPEWLLAIILLLVLSASMSTLSSLVLVSSSAMSIDLYKGYLAPEKSEQHYLWVMRALSALFILLSFLIAFFNPTWIVPLMSLSWGAVAGSFLSPYIYGLFWRKTTKLGAYAGMWTGLIVVNVIYWTIYFHSGPATARLYAPFAASVAIVVPFLVVPVVSLMTKPVKEETVTKAFGDNVIPPVL